VTVVGRDELAAVDPRGTPQWTLARPDVRDPQWFQPTGYRVAYLAGDSLRVVAGDGTGDHLLDGRVQRISPAWRPSHPYQLAYVAAGGRLVVREADSGRSAWSAQPGITVDRLAWSFDGARLLALGAHAVRVYSAGGVLSASLPLPRGAVAVDGALSPDGHAVALVLAGTSNDVLIEGLDHPGSPPRRVLSGVGLGQVAWSPDARWLLVSWPAADQWVFIRAVGPPRVAAVARIAQQFSADARARAFPELDGWCCTVRGPAG
jgi:hypothetical protein